MTRPRPSRAALSASAGRPSQPEGRRQTHDPERIGSVLSRLLASRGYGRPQAHADLHAAWVEIAGEVVAAETKVLGLKNGVLTIGVSSSPLLSELSAFHRERLLAAFVTARGDVVRDLRFRRTPAVRNDRDRQS